VVGVVTWGTLVGSMLPFVLRKAGFDPASSSAPFVATLVDVSGLVIYFTVARQILTGTCSDQFAASALSIAATSSLSSGVTLLL
jgi:hypothetical protein